MRSIYSLPERDGPDWLSSSELEDRLNGHLVGLDLSEYALRTRSKVVKEAICQALGYPVPATFHKTKPRFPAQDLDVYTQKSNNLQIWNEEISPNRRYALLKVDRDSIVRRVRVVRGIDLIPLDTTGTLTTKYQAAYRQPLHGSLLLSEDTAQLLPWVNAGMRQVGVEATPSDQPTRGAILSCQALFECLQGLIGATVSYGGVVQERFRGAALHNAICAALGFSGYADPGSFPDVPNQLLEVKLQTSPTIDLGLVLPTSTDLVDGMESSGLRHCDVRYAVFLGTRLDDQVLLTHLLLCAGQHFFEHFTQFEGLRVNAKLQIPLPADFFSD